MLSRRNCLLTGAGGMLTASLAPRASADPIRLSLNENAFGASPVVAAAVQAELPRIHRYVEDELVAALAAQIAAFEQVEPAQVIIGEVLEPIGLYLGAHARNGEVVYSAPGYTALTDAGAILGLTGRPVPLGSHLANDLPALRRAIGPGTAAVSLVNPHNPTGTVDDIATLDAFVRDASARTLVVVDEAYLEYDPDFAARSAVRHVRAGRNVLVFRTLAKIYGLAGLAVGYAVAQAPLIRNLKGAGIGAAHTLNRLSLVAAAAALTDQLHVTRVRVATAEQRDRLDRVIDRHGWRRTDSHADFVFFQPPDPTALRQRFADAHIAIGKPFPPLDGWVRITIGTPAETDRVASILGG